MVYAYHVIFGAYGFWLPNDPRGSWSDFVGSWELLRFGPATKTETRRSVAAAPHDRVQRLAAKKALKHPAVQFTGIEALTIAKGFDRARQEGAYRVLACAILPEHTHLVIARHQRPIGQIIGHLKGRATRQLHQDRTWPPDRPVWADRGWKVFLDSLEDVQRAIRYVENNPIKENKPRQQWSLISPFDEFLRLI